MKKEKRGRRNPPYRQGKSLRGVLRFDGRLTGAIYCSKKCWRFIPIKLSVSPIPKLP